jgi:hypothetical protein
MALLGLHLRGDAGLAAYAANSPPRGNLGEWRLQLKIGGEYLQQVAGGIP